MEGQGGTKSASAPLPLAFTGSGKEYFRIWIVNLMLTIVTLGFYSAWAKVRRLKYFYQNTRLAGSAFNYHGEPLAILKGRLLALGLLAAWNYAPLDRVWGIAAWILLAALWPWIVVRSMSFKRRNSSWRNVRLRFDGRVREIYLPFALLLALTFVAAYTFYPAAGDGVMPKISRAQAGVGAITAVMLLALTPHFHSVLMHFSVVHTLFGNGRFRFKAQTWAFYKVYLQLGGMAICALFLLGVVMFLAVWAVRAGGGGSTAGLALAVLGIVAIVYGFILFVAPYFIVRIQNLIWNNTRLENHRFRSEARIGKLFRITLGNLLLIVLTLGFYRPFAVIRTLRYRLECISFVPAGDLDAFVAVAEADVTAFGQEAADLFDFDIAL